MKEIILFGAGGHAAVIIDILKSRIATGERICIKGVLDDSNKTECLGFPVLGKINQALEFNQENTAFIIAIGSNHFREQLKNKFKELEYTTAIHPSAIIGSNVEINQGTVVMPQVVINANTKIGKHVIINSGVVVEHDNTIEDYVHLSPNATLCGTVIVKKLTHIGANATIIQGITIGEDTKIGAGTTVINHIDSHVTAVGCPAKVIKNNN